MVLGKLPVPGRPTIWITIGQGHTALAVGAGGVVWTFLLSTILSLSLWETARYRLKYCLKGPLNPKQPTNNLCFIGQEKNTKPTGTDLITGLDYNARAMHSCDSWFLLLLMDLVGWLFWV